MAFLYLLHFINIINHTKEKNIAILSKNNIIIYDKLINDELTGRLLYHGLIINYVNGLHKYQISDNNFNYIFLNTNKKDSIKLIVENSTIFFINKHKNIKIEIGSMNTYEQFPKVYNDLELYF